MARVVAAVSGAHYAIQEAIAAQFTKPPPRDAFRPYGRLRRTRNHIEYDDISPITTDDVRVDETAVRALHANGDTLGADAADLHRLIPRGPRRSRPTETRHSTRPARALMTAQPTTRVAGGAPAPEVRPTSRAIQPDPLESAP